MSIIYQSRSMQQLLDQARRFARTSATVLLTGESGTGKEVLARFLWQHSPRRDQLFLGINCAAFSETLFESELFGHEAGAFTGAAQRRAGRLESAGTGTLFLDEVSELPWTLQPKLLRALEEREFQRVGGNEPVKLQARVFAATNRCLLEEVDEERFRADLFHRLNVLTLHLPPLRERREDIPALVNHFIQGCQSELEFPVRGVTRDVMRELSAYDWPGNLRELKNVVLRMCVLATGSIVDTVELPQHDFPVEEETLDAMPPPFDRLSLEEIERRVILFRLHQHQGNKAQVAEALGVTPRTLRNKVTQYRKLGFAS